MQIEMQWMSNKSNSLVLRSSKVKDALMISEVGVRKVDSINSKDLASTQLKLRKKRYHWLKQKQNSLETDAQTGTKRSKFLESKWFFVLNEFDRGGIAVVWLGRRDGNYFAMKQFPKPNSGKVDPSALVE